MLKTAKSLIVADTVVLHVDLLQYYRDDLYMIIPYGSRILRYDTVTERTVLCERPSIT